MEVREASAQLRQMYGSGVAMARTENLRIGTGAEAIEVRLHVPAGKPRALIVYFHGGGWVTGDLDDFDVLGRKLAQASRSAVLLVNYRLAPEHRFPAAVEDAQRAIEWASSCAAKLAAEEGIKAMPLIVAGDSAGANLATVAARHARDQGGPALAAQILFYPVTDGGMDHPSYQEPDAQALLTADVMRWYWDHYLPDVAGRDNPDASPLKAQDLHGLPPALVITAECDPLRDEGEAYAARLVASGVPTQFERYLGQFHGFFSFVNMLPGSARAIEQVARFIDQRLAP